ncbi:type I-U CRISPR-associated protein Csb2 [uncultured Thiodictyon sp.]|uniref:type I-G CRISPR-associated protein Csb2 n=1 Tax=uncultured Thiodictyon sp. TaxID=1846217 RepID=UPI0025D5A407|nr:type I-U CRISPR-associated protein Csb2 [uncultured Thiodictyon sp.]
MINLRIEFSHGVYRAAEPTAPDLPEYPPAPDRVFQALVSSACEQGIDPAPLTALESAPNIWCAPAERIHTGTNYVPGAFIAGGRPNVERARPEVRVTAPVYLSWPAVPADLAAWLAPVLAGVGYLGRSDSPVALSLADAPDPALTELVPDTEGEELLRVPSLGRLTELLEAHAAGRRSPLATRAGYADRHIQPSPWGEMFVLRPAHGELRQASVLAEALRAAVMSRASDPLPAMLHGHDVGAPDADHAAWVVLPDVDHQWARGAVLGVGMVLPRHVSATERTACVLPLTRVDRIGSVPVRRPLASESTRGIDPKTWSRAAQTWATVTPIVLDRHPKRGQSVERLIADSVVRAGYPAPVGVEVTDYPIQGVPRASAFAARVNGHRTHARLHFANPLRGPMLVGRGRYFGLGLLRPGGL